MPEELREECRKRIPGNMRKVLNQFDRELGRECEREETTEIVFILDRSGSMAGLERDTVGGFNSMIEKQKKEKGSVLVSTVLFDNTAEVLHDRVDLEKIRPLTEKSILWEDVLHFWMLSEGQSIILEMYINMPEWRMCRSVHYLLS